MKATKTIIQDARLTIDKDYDLNQIRATTVHLQDDFLVDLQVIYARWYRASRRYDSATKISTSSMLRIVLEMMMPFIIAMDGVVDEASFRTQLKAMVQEYCSEL